MKAFKAISLGLVMFCILCYTGLTLAEPATTNYDVGTAVITLDSASFVYQGTPITPSFSMVFEGTHTADPAGYTVSFSDNIHSGTGGIQVTGNNIVINDPILGEVTYSGTKEIPFTIQKAKVTVNFPAVDPGLTYNGQAQEITWSISGETSPGDARAYITYYGIDTPPRRASGYIAVVGLNNWDYQTEGDSSYDFTIKRKPVTANFPEGSYTTLVYDGAVRMIPWSISGEITPGDASAQIQYYAYSDGSLPPKDAGYYSASVTVDGWKYEISGASHHNLYIEKRPLTAVFSEEQSFTYNAQVQMPDWHVEGKADGEDPIADMVLTGTNIEPVNIGFYTMTVSLTDAAVNKNYTIPGVKVRNYFINRAPVTFTFPVSDPLYEYNAQAQTIPWSVSDPVEDEDPVVGITYSMSIGEGTPTISAGRHLAIAYLDFSNPINDNYEVSGPFFFTYSIARAPVTVTFPDADPGYTYNGQVQTVPWSVWDPVEGEDPNYSVTYHQYGTLAEPRNVGPYQVYFYMPYDAVNVNYELKSANLFDFFIKQKPLAVTPVAQEKLLGTSTPGISWDYTLSGQVAEETPVFYGGLYCQWEEALGEYPIQKGSLRLAYNDLASVNYTMQFAEGVVFTVKALEGAPDAALDPALPDGKNGWYYSEVKLVPPDGYNIGWSQNPGAYVWRPYLNCWDGVYGPRPYYLRRLSDGAITSAKQAPGYKQDTQNPFIIGSVERGGEDYGPYLKVRAYDNVQLQKVVVREGSKIVLSQNLLSRELDIYNTVYRLVRPGRYSATAYDAAGYVASCASVITVEDTDGDGLSDLWETWQGTDPESRDSDSDGMDDYIAYLTGAIPGGRLPAAAALLLGAQGERAAGKGLSNVFLRSELAADTQDLPLADKSLAQMNDNAVIVQLNIKTGTGWAISEGRLVHFVPGPDRFAPDAVFVLPEPSGSLQPVVLSCADGSVLLLAYFNEATGRAEGGLAVLDTGTKKMAFLAGSQGATAFDLSPDGMQAVFTADGRTQVVNLQTGRGRELNMEAPITMFTPEGRLALGTQGSETLFLQADGSVAPTAYNGFVDTAQRTNTFRQTITLFSGNEATAEARGMLTFSDDGKAIVFEQGDFITQVLRADEV